MFEKAPLGRPIDFPTVPIQFGDLLGIGQLGQKAEIGYHDEEKLAIQPDWPFENLVLGQYGLPSLSTYLTFVIAIPKSDYKIYIVGFRNVNHVLATSVQSANNLIHFKSSSCRASSNIACRSYGLEVPLYPSKS